MQPFYEIAVKWADMYKNICLLILAKWVGIYLSTITYAKFEAVVKIYNSFVLILIFFIGFNTRL